MANIILGHGTASPGGARQRPIESPQVAPQSSKITQWLTACGRR
jgi:hypothetical protein